MAHYQHDCYIKMGPLPEARASLASSWEGRQLLERVNKRPAVDSGFLCSVSQGRLSSLNSLCSSSSRKGIWLWLGGRALAAAPLPLQTRVQRALLHKPATWQPTPVPTVGKV